MSFGVEILRRVRSRRAALGPSRLARRYTLSFSAAALGLISVLIALLYHQSIGAFAEQQEREIILRSLEQRRLAGSLDRSSYVEFVARSNHVRSPTFLMLENTDGILSAFPKDVIACPSLSEFVVWNDHTGNLQNQEGCVTDTAHGWLLVSLNTGPIDDIRRSFFRALTVVGSLAVLLSVLIGRLISNQILNRLRQINRLCADLSIGDKPPKARLPIGKRHDEFDETAGYINHMLETIEHSVAQISGVTDNVAHDLRTPLSRLRLRLESFAEKNQAMSGEDLRGAIEELDAILDTFRAMLELSRLENLPLSDSFSHIDFSAVVRDALDLAEPLLDARTQSLDRSMVETCTVLGDTSLLFQMCFNLLENATKYAGDGASIIVSLTFEQLSVSDNGPGIPADQMDKVLDRFYRVEPHRGSLGNGLGLSFVRAVCRLHGLRLTLSDNHPGLTVTIDLRP